MNKYLFLLILIILGIGLPFVFPFLSSLEGYSNNSLEQSSGIYPNAQTDVLLKDIYPAIGKNELSNNSANDIWTEYPIFQLGSYKQITNNIRYPDTPDEGTCMPASMCGALYENRKIGDNMVHQLPPVSDNGGIRVGYFVTDA